MNMKQEIISEVCSELKGNVIKTWKEGTDKFYNEAKSIVSEYSRAPSSCLHEISRSRSKQGLFTASVESLIKDKASFR
jgi:hypothetical protein